MHLEVALSDVLDKEPLKIASFHTFPYIVFYRNGKGIIKFFPYNFSSHSVLHIKALSLQKT